MQIFYFFINNFFDFIQTSTIIKSFKENKMKKIVALSLTLALAGTAGAFFALSDNADNEKNQSVDALENICENIANNPRDIIIGDGYYVALSENVLSLVPRKTTEFTTGNMSTNDVLTQNNNLNNNLTNNGLNNNNTQNNNINNMAQSNKGTSPYGIGNANAGVLPNNGNGNQVINSNPNINNNDSITNNNTSTNKANRTNHSGGIDSMVRTNNIDTYQNNQNRNIDNVNYDNNGNVNRQNINNQMYANTTDTNNQNANKTNITSNETTTNNQRTKDIKTTTPRQRLALWSINGKNIEQDATSPQLQSELESQRARLEQNINTLQQYLDNNGGTIELSDEASKQLSGYAQVIHNLTGKLMKNHFELSRSMFWFSNANAQSNANNTTSTDTDSTSVSPDYLVIKSILGTRILYMDTINQALEQVNNLLSNELNKTTTPDTDNTDNRFDNISTTNNTQNTTNQNTNITTNPNNNTSTSPNTTNQNIINSSTTKHSTQTNNTNATNQQTNNTAINQPKIDGIVTTPNTNTSANNSTVINSTQQVKSTTQTNNPNIPIDNSKNTGISAQKTVNSAQNNLNKTTLQTA